VAVSDLCILQIVLHLFEVNNGNDTELICLIGSPFFAIGRNQCDVCQVGCLAFLERLLPRLDTLPFEFHLPLFQR